MKVIEDYSVDGRIKKSTQLYEKSRFRQVNMKATSPNLYQLKEDGYHMDDFHTKNFQNHVEMNSRFSRTSSKSKQMLHLHNNNSRVLLCKRRNQVKLEVNIRRMLRPSTSHTIINSQIRVGPEQHKQTSKSPNSMKDPQDPKEVKFLNSLIKRSRQLLIIEQNKKKRKPIIMQKNISHYFEFQWLLEKPLIRTVLERLIFIYPQYIDTQNSASSVKKLSHLIESHRYIMNIFIDVQSQSFTLPINLNLKQLSRRVFSQEIYQEYLRQNYTMGQIANYNILKQQLRDDTLLKKYHDLNRRQEMPMYDYQYSKHFDITGCQIQSPTIQSKNNFIDKQPLQTTYSFDKMKINRLQIPSFDEYVNQILINDLSSVSNFMEGVVKNAVSIGNNYGLSSCIRSKKIRGKNQPYISLPKFLDLYIPNRDELI